MGELASPQGGAAPTGRTAAYGRAAFAWAVKRGTVHTNPFAALPVRKGIAWRERVLSDKLARFGAPPEMPRRPTARSSACCYSPANAAAKWLTL